MDSPAGQHIDYSTCVLHRLNLVQRRDERSRPHEVQADEVGAPFRTSASQLRKNEAPQIISLHVHIAESGGDEKHELFSAALSSARSRRSDSTGRSGFFTSSPLQCVSALTVRDLAGIQPQSSSTFGVSTRCGIEVRPGSAWLAEPADWASRLHSTRHSLGARASRTHSPAITFTARPTASLEGLRVVSLCSCSRYRSRVNSVRVPQYEPIVSGS